MTRQRIRRGVFPLDYRANDNAKPFGWTKSAYIMLAELERLWYYQLEPVQ
jgi:hypothetical protein